VLGLVHNDVLSDVAHGGSTIGLDPERVTAVFDRHVARLSNQRNPASLRFLNRTLFAGVPIPPLEVEIAA
jgi:hypothetical protein